MCKRAVAVSTPAAAADSRPAADTAGWAALAAAALAVTFAPGILIGTWAVTAATVGELASFDG